MENVESLVSIWLRFLWNLSIKVIIFSTIGSKMCSNCKKKKNLKKKKFTIPNILRLTLFCMKVVNKSEIFFYYCIYNLFPCKNKKKMWKMFSHLLGEKTFSTICASKGCTEKKRGKHFPWKISHIKQSKKWK